MANVDLRVSPDITLHIRELQGAFIPSGTAAPLLDNKQSYSVRVDRGEIAIDLAALNTMMSRALGDDRSNVEKLKLSIGSDGSLRQKGVIDSAINIPFSAKSVVSVTENGKIRVANKSVRGFGVPIKPVMKLFGVHMDDLVKVKPGHGVVVADNDLLVDPALLIPAPAVRGHLTAVRIEGDSLIQTFTGKARTEIAPRSLARNHIYWRNGQLAFGKLTMTATDLELVDQDPRDPFDFSVDNWNAQLVAGYSKTLPNRGLRAFMPDYNDLKKR